MMLGTEVHGKTIGIIGFGRIGREVARRAFGFNMKILYYDPVKAPEDIERKYNAQYVDLDTLLEKSDFITIHVPLSKETKHMINREKLRKIKKGAILINTARGGIIDTNALIEALEEGRLAGVGLDVYEEEPLDPNHPLTRFKNVVLVPHIGSATVETRLAMANLVVDNLLAFAKGEIPPTLVNRDVLNIRKPGFH
jgi:glyoxylate reductase